MNMYVMGFSYRGVKSICAGGGGNNLSSQSLRRGKDMESVRWLNRCARSSSTKRPVAHKLISSCCGRLWTFCSDYVSFLRKGIKVLRMRGGDNI